MDDIDEEDSTEEVIKMENSTEDNTIVAFMKQMQIQLSKDIKNTNDNLSQKMTDINEEMITMKNKLDDVKAETEDVKKEMKNQHAEAAMRMSRMEIRIEKIEQEKENFLEKAKKKKR